MIIDYKLLGKAQGIYTKMGYEFIEVPWIVDSYASRATNPPVNGVFELNDGSHLVGSAEQGFIEIMGQLKIGKKYAAISPCFRRNDNRDKYHQEMFMKLELFSYKNDIDGQELFAGGLFQDATDAFYELGIDEEKLYGLLTTDSNIDLCVKVSASHATNDLLEIGSYGTRTIRDFTINYGTGLALPRFQFGLTEQHYELQEGLATL